MSLPAPRPQRKTGMSAARLLSMFEGSAGTLSYAEQQDEISRTFLRSQASEVLTPRSNSSGIGFHQQNTAPRTNSVACQSSMGNGHYGLCELLFQQPPGTVVTADHAYERRLLMQQFDHRQIDLLGEERYNRVQIFLQHRDWMDLMWKVFCKTIPAVTAQQRLLIEQRDYAALKRLKDEEAAAAAAEAEAAAAARQAQPSAALVEENERLKQQVDGLRRQLESKFVTSSSDIGVTSMERRRTIASKAPSVRDLERFSEYLATTLEADCTRAAAAIEELEAEARRTLAAQFEIGLREQEIASAQRVLVVPPFQGYRPKVPTEGSVNPEEFLRRSLVACVFEHYSEAFTTLQEAENTRRNALADTAFAFLASAWAVFVHPHLAQREVELEATVARLQQEKQQILTHVEELALADKLSLVVEAEGNTRAIIDSVRTSDLEMIQGLSQRLETVAKLAKRNMDLQTLLEQQGQRHKRETAVLIAAIENSATEPQAHPAMLPLEARVEYSRATMSASPRKAIPMAQLPKSQRLPAVRISKRSSKDGTPLSSVAPPKAPSTARPLQPALRGGWQPTSRPDSGASSVEDPSRAQERSKLVAGSGEELYFSGYL